MLVDEARWIGDFLRGQPLSAGSSVMDIGAADEHYRSVEQPYIDYYIFRPLRERGVNIFYADARAEKGVDLVCDMLSPESRGMLNGYLGRMDAVICANFLEHVKDPREVFEICFSFTRPGGLFLLSAPRNFPYHPFPIDNGFRPDPEELARFFEGKAQVLGKALLKQPYDEWTDPENVPLRALNRIFRAVKWPYSFKRRNNGDYSASVVAARRFPA